MKRLRCLAPGKVNLCLFVGRPRADGYHPLVSLVQPVSLADELELEPAGGEPRTRSSARASRARTSPRGRSPASAPRPAGTAPPVRVTIAKHVPVAAGMGGGSADAAATLRLAAAAAGQRPGEPELHDVAVGLGADVPSQLAPERCLMTGIGEGVRALGDPEPSGLLIVPSAHALSTPAVYAEFDRLALGRDPDELDRLSGQVPGAARDGSLLAERLLHNDLEAPARSLCPPIGDALADVRAAGAVRAMVSGSGPDRVRPVRRRRGRRARAGGGGGAHGRAIRTRSRRRRSAARSPRPVEV